MLNQLVKLTKNKKYFAIVIALEYEFNWKNLDYQEIIVQKNKYYLCKNIIITFSGVGKVNAAKTTTALISYFNIIGIINIGSACTLNPSCNLFDVNLSKFTQYGDVDVSVDSHYKINQIPYECKKFFCSKQLITKIFKLLSKSLNVNFITGGAITTDSFITINNKNNFHELNKRSIKTIDMESCAIAQVCKFYSKPFAIVKVISDKVAITNNNHQDFTNNINHVQTIINKIVCEIVNKF